MSLLAGLWQLNCPGQLQIGCVECGKESGKSAKEGNTVHGPERPQMAEVAERKADVVFSIIFIHLQARHEEHTVIAN